MHCFDLTKNCLKSTIASIREFQVFRHLLRHTKNYGGALPLLYKRKINEYLII